MSEYTPTTDVMRETFQAVVKVTSGKPAAVEEAGKEFDRWLDAVIRAAKAEGWDAAIDLAVSTLDDYASGDEVGQPVTVAGMATYINSAINPYQGGPR